MIVSAQYLLGCNKWQFYYHHHHFCHRWRTLSRKTAPYLRRQYHAWHLLLGIGVLNKEQSCGTEFFTCGTWCHIQVGSVRIELNCRTLSWCCTEMLGVENPRTVGAPKWSVLYDRRHIGGAVFFPNMSVYWKMAKMMMMIVKLPFITSK